MVDDDLIVALKSDVKKKRKKYVEDISLLRETALMYFFIKNRKFPEDLSKYSKKEIPASDADAKIIAEKISSNDDYTKVKLQDRKIYFKDVIKLTGWGNMYILDVGEDSITLYYRQSGYGKPFPKDLDNFTNFLSTIIS